MSCKRLKIMLEDWEMEAAESLSTKKELAMKPKAPRCPIPIKRKSMSRKNLEQNQKASALCFNNNAVLSPMYDPQQKKSYLDQVFSKFGFIGEGSFGKVIRVRSKEDNKLYAVKKLKPFVGSFLRHAEVKNNEIVGYHPYCVQYFMAWEENCNTYILLEYCDMSLADFTQLSTNVSEDLLWNVLFDICKALNFLHKRNLVHLDVKPANIMMKKGFFKLGDFGLLVDLHVEGQVRRSTLSDGDAKYLAPEVLKGTYKPACDIFGLGISVFELATDIMLPDHGELWHKIRYHKLPKRFSKGISSSMITILEKMTECDHNDRPSAEEVLSYPHLTHVAKPDGESPRKDYAAPYVKDDDSYDYLPLSPIDMNSNDTNASTPPNTLRSPFLCMDDDDDEDGVYSFEYRERSDTDKNRSIQHLDRKSLFDDGTPRTHDPSSRESELDSILANSLSDSGNSDCDNNNEDVQVYSSPLMMSTPILRSKFTNVAKTKLAFDAN